MWFALWSIRQVGMVLVFPFYLSLFLELMVLFLLGASCLPDEPLADCDLATFYERNQRSLWLIFSVFQISFFLHWLYFGGMEAPLWSWLAVLTPLAIYLLLAVVRNRWLHLAAPAALIIWELYLNWSSSLGDRLANVRNGSKADIGGRRSGLWRRHHSLDQRQHWKTAGPAVFHGV